MRVTKKLEAALHFQQLQSKTYENYSSIIHEILSARLNQLELESVENVRFNVSIFQKDFTIVGVLEFDVDPEEWCLVVLSKSHDIG